MKLHTQPPYHLTLKSNGCLILISALSPFHLVVASKHSLGTTTDDQDAGKADAADPLADEVSALLINDRAATRADKQGKQEKKGTLQQAEANGEQEARAHAEVGRGWLRRSLKAKGKTEAELARRLWENNFTAVFEVGLLSPAFENGG
jgi:tRNA ligase